MKKETTKFNKSKYVFNGENRLDEFRRESLELQSALNGLREELTQLMKVSELLFRETQDETLIH
jgi:hypothetical protein